MTPEPKSAEEIAVEIARDWKLFWMNQKQNSKQDYDNYFRRALGVDANMRVHLETLIAAAIKARDDEWEKNTAACTAANEAHSTKMAEVAYARGLREGAMARVTGPDDNSPEFNSKANAILKAHGIVARNSFYVGFEYFRDNLRVTPVAVDELMLDEDTLMTWIRTKIDKEGIRPNEFQTRMFIRDHIAKKLGGV